MTNIMDMEKIQDPRQAVEFADINQMEGTEEAERPSSSPLKVQPNARRNWPWVLEPLTISGYAMQAIQEQDSEGTT